jgi:phosphopantothenoylcysteine decarboxylase/phosphopantothenate--cysteine ligase
MTLLLKKNVDIAFELGRIKRPGQVHVGFALETENEVLHAQGKLEKKNFDLIVLNSAREEGAGFQHDTNRVRIIHRDGRMADSGLAPKSAVAGLILDEIKNAQVSI